MTQGKKFDDQMDKEFRSTVRFRKVLRLKSTKVSQRRKGPFGDNLVDFLEAVDIP